MFSIPIISVICPVYNAERYLHRCIDSILLQSFTDFELLLIDDGSTDRSGVICDEYALKDSRISVYHKKNGGVSSARNLGLDKAKGEYITFVDSDDYVLPAFLAIFLKQNHYKADLYIQAFLFNNNIKILKDSFEYKGDVQGALYKLITCEMTGSLWNKLFKKSIIRNNKLRLNESFKFKEDEEFLLRYINLSKNVITSKEGAYVYTVPEWGKYSSCNNVETYLSMYCSVLQIFEGKANTITDFYQVYLCNEWVSMLRADFLKAIKLLPRIMGALGFRIFRMSSIKATFNKIIEFIKK